MHYLKKCLYDYDTSFKYSNLIVLKATMKMLIDTSMEKFREKGLKFE